MRLHASDTAAATNFLRHEGWLSKTPPDFRESLLARGQWRRVEPGATLSHGGDTEGGMYALASGWIAVTSVSGPADTLPFHYAGAPFWFGSNPLLGGRPRIVSVTVRSEGLAAYFPRHALDNMLAARPDWWRQIASLHSDLLAEAFAALGDSMIRDSRTRCLAVLLRLGGRRAAGNAPVEIPVSQDDVAALAAMTRKTAGLILRSLADDGLIETAYRSLTLRAPAALRTLVDQVPGP